MTRRPAPWEVDDPDRRISLHAWGDDPGTDQLRVIEEDVRVLVRGLAAARAELTDIESVHRREQERNLVALLEVLDGFERVFANVHRREAEVTPPMRAWIDNFRTVHRLLGRALRDQGVTPIETPTREFDPRWHTAAETVVDGSLAPGTIVEEIKRGYVWHRQVLRKTEVVVVREDLDPEGQSTEARTETSATVQIMP